MAFSISNFAVAATVATGALLSVMGNANAQGPGFTFDNKVSNDTDAKEDVFLESVTIDGEIITDFSFVSGVEIVENDDFLGGNSGGASADKGVNSTTGVSVEDAAADDILTNLGNNNLNNIIDTEDTGSFVIDLTFEKIIDNLLIWERGLNSDLGIQAVDAQGNLVGNRLVIESDQWQDAGFDILTKELQAESASAQDVGSLGINIIEDLGVQGNRVQTIRFFSESAFNGPDWKFVGTENKDIPEPAFILGLGMLGGAFGMLKRRVA